MEIEQITENARLTKIIKAAQKESKGRHYSDIIDENGNQYVDFVMEGGGMLGIALVGYVYVLEKVGIRFLGLAGTSAGSINALLLAALGPPGEEKGRKLLQLLANKNFWDFVDGDSDAKDFISSWLKDRKIEKKIKFLFKAAQVIDNFQEDMGLNPGSNFLMWIQSILRREGIFTTWDLEYRMRTLPTGIAVRGGAEPFLKSDDLFARLAIIAADVATETKVEFPRMAPLYWENPENVDPALFVRASMSIPYFFQPMEVKPLPKSREHEKMWDTMAGLICKNEKRWPDRGLFVDGGIISNFPINVFHDYSQVPRCPTFGVKLQLDRRLQDISGPVSLGMSIFNSARHALDYDFIAQNRDYQKLVQWIPAEGFNWLDFGMSDPEKVNLFVHGAEEAQKFLKGFNWESYKKLRQSMIDETAD